MKTPPTLPSSEARPSHVAICRGGTLSPRLKSMGATHSKRRKTSAAEEDDGDAADQMERGTRARPARQPPKDRDGGTNPASRSRSPSRVSQPRDDSGQGCSSRWKKSAQPTVAAPKQRVTVETGAKAPNAAKPAASRRVAGKPAPSVAKAAKSALAKSRLRETTQRTASAPTPTPADAAAGTAGDRASTSADASCSGVSSALRSARRKRAAENEVSTEL